MAVLSQLRTLNSLKPSNQDETHILLSRRFIECSEVQDTGQVVRVMQWNMLAQGLTISGPRKNYCKTKARHLSWDTRRYLLLLELLSYLPDIIILQEVDRYQFLELKLKEFGYKGKFIERPFSPCLEMLDEDEAKPDGCAIFYHTERFHYVDCVSRQLLNQMQHSTSTIAMALKLQFLEDSIPILVVNTHLKGGPKTELNRYEACVDLLNFISENSEDGQVVVVGADICEEPSQRGYERLVSQFRDVYSDALDGEHPSFTTWRVRPLGEEKYVNDVMLYEKQQLRVVRVLDAPPDSTMGELRLPNNFCASDHISLVADFQRVVY